MDLDGDMRSAFLERFEALHDDGILAGSIAEIFQRVLAIRNAALQRAAECKGAGDRSTAARHLRSARVYERLAFNIVAEYEPAWALRTAKRLA